MKLERKSIILLAIIGVLPILAFFFAQPPRPPLPPNPNGYDDFAAAALMLTGDEPDDQTASVEAFRAFVATNHAALERARAGLTKLCGVQTEYSTTWIEKHMQQMMSTKRLAGAFCAEGNLARMEHRPGDAAASYLNAIELGAMVAHGGLMIDGLVSIACEEKGEARLSSLMETLDGAQFRKLVSGLERVESELEPSAKIMEREKAWAAAQMRTIQGLTEHIKEVIETRSLNPSTAMRTSFLAAYDLRLLYVPQLKAKLAAHAYTLEKVHAPTNWNELVPAYLKVVPSVPFAPGDTNLLKIH